jgi:hypothetical protein
VRAGGRTSVVAAAAAVVLLAGVAVVGLDRADRTTALSESDAVERFRAASPGPSPSPSSAVAPSAAVPRPGGPTAAAAAPVAPAVAAPDAPMTPGPPPVPGAAPRAVAPAPAAGRPEPPTGVYRYATEGFEEVDALGGARHDYPATTTITISRAGCGSEERWQPLQERVGSTFTCAGPEGGELRATRQRREFFGQSQEKAYTCEPGVLVRPMAPRPGATWTGECRSEDSRIALSGRVIGFEDLVVEGRRVPVVHIRLAGALTGSTRGRSDREVWLARSDGLLVQAVGSTDTDADTPGGEVRYRETYRLRLLSLTPRR